MRLQRLEKRSDGAVDAKFVMETGDTCDVVFTARQYNGMWVASPDRDILAWTPLTAEGGHTINAAVLRFLAASARGSDPRMPPAPQVTSVDELAASQKGQRKLRLASEYGGGCLWIGEEPYSLDVNHLEDLRSITEGTDRLGRVARRSAERRGAARLELPFGSVADRVQLDRVGVGRETIS